MKQSVPTNPSSITYPVDTVRRAVKGLEWSVRRRRAGHETLTSFALALRLVVARCLRRLGRLDEAEYNFKILAGEPWRPTPAAACMSWIGASRVACASPCRSLSSCLQRSRVD